MAVQGAQVISRVGLVLRIVSEHAPRGITTAELARQSGLTRPTAHRMLVSLAAEGFVDHDSVLGRWLLGPELYLMGSIAAARYDVTEVAAPSVVSLARETGESAFLSARRGHETVCLMREEGSFPLRSFVLYEGVRFPLGVASAGLAILSYMSDDDVAEYLDRRPLHQEWGEGHSKSAISQRIDKTRRLGWALNPGLILEGSFGMGAAIFDAAGKPAWALSITGVESRYGQDHQPELGRLLLHYAHQVTQQLRVPAGRRQ